MYQYLKSIGFGKYKTRKEINELICFVKENANYKTEYDLNEKESICLYEKEAGEGFGIAVVEIQDESGYKMIDAFYPYVRGMNFLYHEDPEFEKFRGREEYACICDENNLGIPLIFHINNIIEYLRFKRNGETGAINSMTLSGIATKGTVILPIEKNEYQERAEQRENELRNQRIDAAKAGDVEAMEQLTLEDMDTYTMVSSRSRKEDLFTIVSSYFMPYSVECDKYSVLGEIKEVTEVKNRLTEEELFYISLECNSLQIEFTIAKTEIVGIPVKGRRFKGNIWLQGEIDIL